MATHAHPLDADRVDAALAAGLGAADSEALADLLGLLADPVRIRVLFCLAAVDELCVGDLALALGITADQSSYALRTLKAARLVQARRDGRVMHYGIADAFPQPLLDHCLRQLLTIATGTDEP